eukprot:27729-Pelagococcus_subviridis.AAC.2
MPHSVFATFRASNAGETSTAGRRSARTDVGAEFKGVSRRRNRGVGGEKRTTGHVSPQATDGDHRANERRTRSCGDQCEYERAYASRERVEKSRRRRLAERRLRVVPYKRMSGWSS